MAVTYRRLEPGDEPVVRVLASEAARFESVASDPQHEPLSDADAADFLGDDRNQLDVAFDGDRPVGMLLAYELDRRHGDKRILFVYELGVDADYRRRGLARTLMVRAADRARERGISRGFVITDEGNEAALAFYLAEGGIRRRGDDVVIDFDFGEG